MAYNNRHFRQQPRLALLNSTDLATENSLVDWKTSLVENNYRGILLCPEHKLAQLKEELRQVPSECILDCSEIDQQQAQDNLGNEFEYIVFYLSDTNSSSPNFNVNLFCSVSGGLCGGGIMIVVYPDPHPQSIAIFEQTPSKIVKSLCSQEQLPFLFKRLIQLMNTQDFLKFYSGQNLTSSKPTHKLSPSNLNAVEEQARIIQRIKKVATGHSRRPLVLTSDRGRGKSSAMGIASAELISDSARQIAVVAPSLSNLSSFFWHAEKTLADSDALAKSHRTELASRSGGKIKFITASNLAQTDSQRKREFDIVMIDEAAAIPVALLEQINSKFNRIVYATTCHGYEGNGQGFEIRFKQKLISVRPQTRFESLKEPFRWALGDPLESALSSTFLFNKDIQPLDISVPLEIGSKPDSKPNSSIRSLCQFEIYSQQSLRENTSLLASVFSLLVNAHYQTRPADLQAMLTNKAMTVCGLVLEGRLVAVALLNAEGHLNPEQVENVYTRKQLSNGHLLPQSLIANYGIQQAGQLSFLRVMRIAVHPALKRQGMGSELLKQISNDWRDKTDIIGTSFAASNDVVSFWCKNHYQPIRIGAAKDSSTGEVSVEFLLPLNSIGQEITDRVTQRFIAIYQFNFPTYCKQLELSALRQIFLLTPAVNHTLDNTEKLELRQFSDGHRALSLIGDLLTKWLLAEKLAFKKQLTPEEFEILLFVTLSRLPLTQLAEELQFSGKKQLLVQLRQICAKLLNSDAASNSNN